MPPAPSLTAAGTVATLAAAAALHLPANAGALANVEAYALARYPSLWA